jgi:hypothetical protein
MKGLVILILGFLTFQPVAFSELLTQIDPNIAAESDTGQRRIGYRTAWQRVDGNLTVLYRGTRFHQLLPT